MTQASCEKHVPGEKSATTLSRGYSVTDTSISRSRQSSVYSLGNTQVSMVSTGNYGGSNSSSADLDGDSAGVRGDYMKRASAVPMLLRQPVCATCAARAPVRTSAVQGTFTVGFQTCWGCFHSTG